MRAMLTVRLAGGAVIPGLQLEDFFLIVLSTTLIKDKEKGA
jgi:hypothetical protein